ncbi:MAG: hypothetical protein G01um10147_473 [Microgenomates group bacterium Gr01-1014_7]|nr:MAG: hypothetical protein G01um10147_473 [Microgenomates group bacterium Gr01-1014_7]
MMGEQILNWYRDLLDEGIPETQYITKVVELSSNFKDEAIRREPFLYLLYQREGNYVQNSTLEHDLTLGAEEVSSNLLRRHPDNASAKVIYSAGVQRLLVPFHTHVELVEDCFRETPYAGF